MEKNNPNGSLLKQAREDKGMTLEIVHEATKIPLDSLRAIEDGYSVRSLTPFYLRGFIKMYAEFLGVDPKEALLAYGVGETPGPAAVPSKPVSTWKRPLQKPLVSNQSQEGLERLKESFAVIFSKRNVAAIGKLIVLIIAFVFVLRIGGCVINGVKGMFKPKSAQELLKEHRQLEQKKQEQKKEEQKKAEKKVEKKTVVPVEAKGDDAVKAKDTIKAPVSMISKVSLAVRASKDTWIQVKADGKVVFQMTMKKGTMENWSATSEIILSGKNINELDMEVNGKHVGPLGSAERKAKKVVITKEGLTVKK